MDISHTNLPKHLLKYGKLAVGTRFMARAGFDWLTGVFDSVLADHLQACIGSRPW